jgi:hypothetical protein
MQSGAETTITISLDRRIPLEALVLNRLHRLPELRRDEWLRYLLILGFRVDCDSIKAQQLILTQQVAMSGSAKLDPGWLRQAASEAVVSLVEVADPTSFSTHSKPFAQLTKVIGA